MGRVITNLPFYVAIFSEWLNLLALTGHFVKKNVDVLIRICKLLIIGINNSDKQGKNRAANK
jgi:hypothetical protein